IFQADPAKIFGSLNANGQIYLINQNGIIFGATAQVNVGGLLASSLSPTQSAITNGLTTPAQAGSPTLQAFSNGLPSGAVTVQAGASIQTANAGTVLMFAPQITNEGTIQAPGGQVILAAGSPIYLASSTDPNIRGLLVEVGSTGGTVTNGDAGDATVTSPQQLVGQIIAEHGNVTLAGLSVNQLGRVSATTTVNENGSIRLQARDNGSASNGQLVTGTTGGFLTLGPNSVTGVTLETSDPTLTVDSVPQLKSAVEMYGSNMQIQSGSRVTATSGTIDVTAIANQQANVGGSLQPDGSRIYVAPDATLDVSGVTVELPASANIIPVQLRGTEFANFPLQRNGPLRGDTVYIDIRPYKLNPDGTIAWQGTPLADVSGEIGAIQRNVAERNLTGGTVTLQSQGDVIVAPSATVNIAGGALHYDAGYSNTTKLITAAGTLVDIANADPNQVYTGIATSSTVSHPKWGVTTTYPSSAGNPTTTYQPAYTEGKDAGTLNLTASKFIFDGTLDGQVTVGTYQRLPTAAVIPPQPTDPSLPLIYRPYDQVPRAGTLVIGLGTNSSGGAPQPFVGDVTIASQSVLPGLMAGGAFDPTQQDPLPASYSASILRPDLVGPQGIGNLEIFSEGKVTPPAGVRLSFPAGGTLGITANTIDLLGSVDVPSGTITAVAEQTSALPLGALESTLSVGPESELTARGAWVNDSVSLNPNGPTAPLFTSGGTVSLTALGGNLTVSAGSLIDVSGGAQLTSSGKMVVGSGGKIALAATPYTG
ncbi:MAG: filamentous hemagglutinin N-terminal domain-containing protein, partial [Steroidobacteraceae bacterium]